MWPKDWTASLRTCFDVRFIKTWRNAHLAFFTDMTAFFVLEHLREPFVESPAFAKLGLDDEVAGLVDAADPRT